MRTLSVLLSAAMAFAASPKTAPPPAEPTPVVVKAPELARVVQYGPRDTVRIVTRPRYVTAIVLPESEKIADFLIGDKDFWHLHGRLNMAWIKPAQNKSETNLQLLTMSGNIYTFQAVSDEAQEADFKVFVEPKDEGMLKAIASPPRFVEAAAVKGLELELEQWKIEAARLRKETEAKVEEAKAQAAAKAPTLAKHDYKFRANYAPFNVAAMWHDERFTYIQAKPEELPALYEERDGKPNLVKFDYSDGLYTVDKVLQGGYFKIGKKQLEFERF